jgi:hypothetical protein
MRDDMVACSSSFRIAEFQQEFHVNDTPNEDGLKDGSLRLRQPLVKEPAVDFAIGKLKYLPLINADAVDEKNSRFFFRSALSAFISGEIFLFDRGAR